MADSTQNDPDDRFTEDLVRRTLGPRCTPGILARIREAENRLVMRKDNLADLLNVKVIDPGEFAERVNRVAAVYLQTVADIVGEDVCKTLYDFGPNDKIQIVDPARMRHRTEYLLTPESLADIVADELVVAGKGVSATKEWSKFNEELAGVIQFITWKSDWMKEDGDHRVMIAYWQAASLAIFLAHVLTGGSAADLIWRVCEKVLLFAGYRLRPSDASDPHDLYITARAEGVAPDDLMDVLRKFAHLVGTPTISPQ
jgi:hypothetical protein